jgi:ketosteroid isomerase-like protein
MNIATAFACAVALGLSALAPPAKAQDQDGAYVAATSALAAEDEVRIASIIARMNHAVDLEDYALYASFYTADGVIDSGFGPPVEGREAITASLTQSAPFITGKRHAATNIVLNGQGDMATAVYYLIVFERVEGLTIAGTAHITDTFARTPEGWQVTRHETRMDPATLTAMQQ